MKSARYFNFDPLRFSLPPPRPVPEERQAMIAKAAYYRAERRHFEPGHELEDWLAAEAEINRRLPPASWEEREDRRPFVPSR
jgi:hypothetical protein